MSDPNTTIIRPNDESCNADFLKPSQCNRFVRSLMSSETFCWRTPPITQRRQKNFDFRKRPIRRLGSSDCSSRFLRHDSSWLDGHSCASRTRIHSDNIHGMNPSVTFNLCRASKFRKSDDLIWSCFARDCPKQFMATEMPMVSPKFGDR